MALRGVCLEVEPGEIRAVVGPNGSGKSTLIRILGGVVEPSSGIARVLGGPPGTQAARRQMGWTPSGDRTFYLRISGLENLVFFGRLHGLSYREAEQRAFLVLEEVGLLDSARVPVGLYSHGMQKRLALARAFLSDAKVLLFDEATHDLDPDGQDQVQALVRHTARRGAAVVWITQRLEELRGFAHTVTVLAGGEVRFAGPFSELASHGPARQYLLHVSDGGKLDERRSPSAVLGGLGTLVPEPTGENGRYLLALAPTAVLGDAIAALTGHDYKVLACEERRPHLEEAFLRLTRDDQAPTQSRGCRRCQPASPAEVAPSVRWRSTA